MYIGTAEERAKQKMGDDDAQLVIGAGHMVKLPLFLNNAPKSLQKLMRKDPSIAEFINNMVDEIGSHHSTDGQANSKS